MGDCFSVFTHHNVCERWVVCSHTKLRQVLFSDVWRLRRSFKKAFLVTLILTMAPGLTAGSISYLWFPAPAEADQVTLPHKEIRAEFFLLASTLKEERRIPSAYYCTHNSQKETFRSQKQMTMTYQWRCSPIGQTQWWSAYQRRQGRDRTASTKSQPDQACSWWTQEISHSTNYSAMIMSPLILLAAHGHLCHFSVVHFLLGI